jgi:hypothetical protein
MRVFVTGGTGLVGTRLVRQLTARKDEVVLLTRRPGAARDRFGTGVEVVEGDPTKAGGWMEAVDRCDAVINLAGENIFNKRWRQRFRELLHSSRVEGTANVVAALARRPHRDDGSPKVLVNASAIGYYGVHGDEEITEESPPGNDFLASICIEWEKKANEGQALGLRVALVRVGIVLDREGGALAKMLTPFKLFVGGPVGSGRQWMSWIHHEDMVGLFLLGLDHSQATGPINGTAPNPVTNKQFAKALGKAMHRPSFFKTPGFMLRLTLGKVAEVITTGQRVLPKKALQLGYQFRFPELDAALADIFGSGS